MAIRSGVRGLSVLQLAVLDFAYGTVLVQIPLPVLMARTALTWEVKIRQRNATVRRNVLN